MASLKFLSCYHSSDKGISKPTELLILWPAVGDILDFGDFGFLIFVFLGVISFGSTVAHYWLFRVVLLFWRWLNDSTWEHVAIKVNCK